VRYWAASGRPGTDTAFDTGQMKVGRRLAIKLLNASKFVLARPEPRGRILHPIDVGLLTSLAPLVRESTERLERDYDYTWVLQKTESFFWDFCDNYLELVKARRYGDFGEDAAGSANSGMLLALSMLQRLFAPYLPFVAEEVWSWWQPGSVHGSPWPSEHEIAGAIGAPNADALTAYVRAREVLAAIRKRKSEQGLSTGAQLDRVLIRNNEKLSDRFPSVWPDLRTAVRAETIDFIEDTVFDVEIVPKVQERGA
jgi:valyl-tRNA synthetase